MDRITKAHLANLVALINRKTGSPQQPYTRENDELVKHPGSFYISYSYGGVALSHLLESGGDTDVFGSGHTTKRDLYNRLRAFYKALEMTKDARVAL